MLARDRSPERHDGAKDLLDGGLALAAPSLRLTRRLNDVDVNVPVGRVSVAHGGQAAPESDRSDRGEQLRQPGAGHRAVFFGVGAELLDRLADGPAQAPEVGRLAVVQRHAHVGGAGVQQGLSEALGVARDGVLFEAVGLDEEMRVGIRRQRQVEPPGRHLGRPAFHELARRGLAALSVQPGDGGQGLPLVGEGSPEETPVSGERQQAQGRLRDHAESAFASDEQGDEVVPRHVLPVPAAQVENRAAGHDDAQPRDVPAGRAVLGGARAPGVLGDVAADGAGAAGGRVRRIEEAGAFRLFLHELRHGAGLDDREQVLAVDLEDPAHPAQVQRDSPAHRKRPARKPRQRALGRDREAELPGGRQQGRTTSSSVRGRTTSSGRARRSSVSSWEWVSRESGSAWRISAGRRRESASTSRAPVTARP